MNRIVDNNFLFESSDPSSSQKLPETPLHEDMKPETDYVQRKVYCSLCPKRFWSLQDLRRHVRSHTGMLKYILLFTVNNTTVTHKFDTEINQNLQDFFKKCFLGTYRSWKQMTQ